MNEKLLDAWLKLTTAIVNERVVTDLPYNESVICNILVRLNMSQMEIYQRQHERILALIDRLLEQIGPEKAEDIVDLFTQIANTAEEIIK